VKLITTNTGLTFPFEENVLIKPTANITITLPAITANALGMIFNFITNSLTFTVEFASNGTNTIVRNGAVLGSSNVILLGNGITSTQLTCLELNAGVYSWVVVNSSLPQTISNPVGSIITMAVSTTIPLGYLACDGASYSGGTYSALFGVLGSLYGSAGVGFFNVPNFNNGSFLRGFSSGISSAIGTQQGESIKAHTHNFTFQVPNNIGSGSSSRACEVATSGYTTTISTQSNTAGSPDETRPKNFAILYYIKY
jgi:microcystin-dependent protein